jgi:hypothetical protein
MRNEKIFFHREKTDRNAFESHTSLTKVGKIATIKRGGHSQPAKCSAG